MRFEAWDLRSLYRSVTRVKLDFVGAQEIRWNKRGIESAYNYTFFCLNGNTNQFFGTFSYIQETDEDEVS
jgi:hypothetical protein